MLTVVLAISTAIDRSYWITVSSSPQVKLRRFRSTPTVPVHSSVTTSFEIQRLSVVAVSVKERTRRVLSDSTKAVCFVRGIVSYAFRPIGICK